MHPSRQQLFDSIRVCARARACVCVLGWMVDTHQAGATLPASSPVHAPPTSERGNGRLVLEHVPVLAALDLILDGDAAAGLGGNAHRVVLVVIRAPEVNHLGRRRGPQARKERRLDCDGRGWREQLQPASLIVCPVCLRLVPVPQSGVQVQTTNDGAPLHV